MGEHRIIDLTPSGPMILLPGNGLITVHAYGHGVKTWVAADISTGHLGTAGLSSRVTIGPGEAAEFGAALIAAAKAAGWTDPNEVAEQPA
jgi:hypothetical protein